ncbi:hypothetical protein NVP1063O_113 [Vibrio phage 1.063.O._10N.261.45.C7]|nr:hypothetical protein NVP1063O_113 [Vibrio phage 1.063.O._10N.261.45.C7]
MDTKLITESCKQLDNIGTMKSRIMQDGLEGFSGLSHTLPEELQSWLVTVVKKELDLASKEIEAVIKVATK